VKKVGQLQEPPDKDLALFGDLWGDLFRDDLFRDDLFRDDLFRDDLLRDFTNFLNIFFVLKRKKKKIQIFLAFFAVPDKCLEFYRVTLH
jgi:hypothetical protein